MKEKILEFWENKKKRYILLSLLLLILLISIIVPLTSKKKSIGSKEPEVFVPNQSQIKWDQKDVPEFYVTPKGFLTIDPRQAVDYRGPQDGTLADIYSIIDLIEDGDSINIDGVDYLIGVGLDWDQPLPGGPYWLKSDEVTYTTNDFQAHGYVREVVERSPRAKGIYLPHLAPGTPYDASKSNPIQSSEYISDSEKVDATINGVSIHDGGQEYNASNWTWEITSGAGTKIANVTPSYNSVPFSALDEIIDDSNNDGKNIPANGVEPSTTFNYDKGVSPQNASWILFYDGVLMGSTITVSHNNEPSGFEVSSSDYNPGIVGSPGYTPDPVIIPAPKSISDTITILTTVYTAVEKRTVVSPQLPQEAIYYIDASDPTRLTTDVTKSVGYQEEIIPAHSLASYDQVMNSIKNGWLHVDGHAYSYKGQ